MQVHPIHTATVIGVDGHPIRVEVDLLRRLPAVSSLDCPMVPFESADQIRSAMRTRDSISTESRHKLGTSRYQIWHTV